MNDIGKALEELEKLSRYAEILKSPEEFFHHMQGHTTELSLVLSAFGIAEINKDIKTALEKQIPKKLEYEHGSWQCSMCGNAPNEENCLNIEDEMPPFEFCPYCGQKIDLGGSE